MQLKKQKDKTEKKKDKEKKELGSRGQKGD